MQALINSERKKSIRENHKRGLGNLTKTIGSLLEQQHKK